MVISYGHRYRSAEEDRLDASRAMTAHWKRWGCYLSERQWSTVREDYSGNGDAWTHFPYEHARSRVYRWGEDGIGGISDNHQRLCLSLAFWNEEDDTLKERLFGTTGHQGNHGEDVKEIYYYLDCTPTHSYMKMLYKYPQRKFPYEQLVRESSNRSRDIGEFEITDTDAFDDNRYWDIFIEYAKDAENFEEMSIRITAFNRGPKQASLRIIPQLLFRNTWAWTVKKPQGKQMPNIRAISANTMQATHPTLGTRYLYCTNSPGVRSDAPDIEPELLFTENDTNFRRLYNVEDKTAFVKDAFHDHIIDGHRGLSQDRPERHDSETPEKSIDNPANAEDEGSENRKPHVNPAKTGTKACAHYTFKDVPGNGGVAVVRIRLTDRHGEVEQVVGDDEAFDHVVESRLEEANDFYSKIAPMPLSDDLRNIQRQALAGMLWSKQFYLYIQTEWLKGDPTQPPPPSERQWVRNRAWKHLFIDDVLSMPDKWEYPFFAVWDTAFHTIPLAMVDPDFAKKQLDLFTREWYMKPDGQIPAYEWNFGDVNPPVHAWATFRVFKIERKLYGREDLDFLERVFQKLLLNFTWWVNRKDASGNNVFEGGFLGLDNIGPFNRSEPLPTGGILRQADGTAWMGFFCLNMLNIALELAKHNRTYEDIASKFFEHFIFISDAMTFPDSNGEALSLWNDEDGFYYDAISWGHGHSQQLPVRSLVGLIPLYATLTLEPAVIKQFPGFRKRMQWFIDNRRDMAERTMASMDQPGKGDRILLSLVNKDRLCRILRRMLDEKEFLSEYGIRSLSKYHQDKPFQMNVKGQDFSVGYWPGESHSGMFGGNSNWRGPIWLATTFLIIESLQRFFQYYGDSLKVECPAGSGEHLHLGQVAQEIQHRLIHIFAKSEDDGSRAVNGNNSLMNKDPHFRNYVLFYEYMHADTGKGLGASHQTGWTGLVAYLIHQNGLSCRAPRTPRSPRAQAESYFDEVHPTTPSEQLESFKLNPAEAEEESHEPSDL